MLHHMKKASFFITENLKSTCSCPVHAMTLDNWDLFLWDLQLFSWMDSRWGNAIQKRLSSETLHVELKYPGPNSNLYNYIQLGQWNFLTSATYSSISRFKKCQVHMDNILIGSVANWHYRNTQQKDIWVCANATWLMVSICSQLIYSMASKLQHDICFALHTVLLAQWAFIVSLNVSVRQPSNCKFCFWLPSNVPSFKYFKQQNLYEAM